MGGAWVRLGWWALLPRCYGALGEAFLVWAWWEEPRDGGTASKETDTELHLVARAQSRRLTKTVYSAPLGSLS